MNYELNINEVAKDRHLEPDEVIKVLLPYQAKWVGDNRGVKLHTKSRRIGVSWAEACDRVIDASSASGDNTYYLAYEKDMTRQFIEDCSNWAKALKFVASEVEEDIEIFRNGEEEKSIQIYRIFFNSGFKIEALSSQPRTLRSKQGTIVIDECAFHDDFAGVLKAARAMRVWGSEIHMITTYNGIDEPYYQMEQEVIKGRLNYARHFTTFDMAIEQGLYKQICFVKGWEWSDKKELEWYNQTLEEFGEDADEELHCIPKASGGSYFSRALVESCMDEEIPVLNLTLKDSFAQLSAKIKEAEVEDWLRQHVQPLFCTDVPWNVSNKIHPHYKTSYGFDFGRSGDLSYLIVFQELPNLLRKSVFALELRNVPFAEQEQILFYVGDRIPRLVGGAHDARGNGGYLAEKAATRYGYNKIEQVKLTLEWYRDNMPKYKAALEDKKVLLPADSNLLDDHRAVEVIRGVPKVSDTKNKGTDGKQRHGDGAIACALAWYASGFDHENVQRAIGSMAFNSYDFM